MYSVEFLSNWSFCSKSVVYETTRTKQKAKTNKTKPGTSSPCCPPPPRSPLHPPSPQYGSEPPYVCFICKAPSFQVYLVEGIRRSAWFLVTALQRIRTNRKTQIDVDKNTHARASTRSPGSMITEAEKSHNRLPVNCRLGSWEYG